MDTSGNMYFAHYNKNRFRKIATGTKIVTNFAGNGGTTFAGMDGMATSAGIPGLKSFVVGDSSGSIFIGTSYGRVLGVDGATNIISIIAGKFSCYFHI
jgi:hypothetical protein